MAQIPFEPDYQPSQESVRLLETAAAHCNAQRYAEAEAVCRETLKIDPRDPQGLRLMGVVCRNTDRVDEAITYLEQAVELAPQVAAFVFELGAAFKMADRLQEALECFTKAVELKPILWQAHNNASSVLDEFGRFDESLRWSLAALRIAPEQAICHYNLGNAQMGLAHIDSARLSYQRAIEIEPDHAKAHWNLALCHLLKGDFKKGWQEHEWRETAGQVFFDKYPYPLWQGEPLQGKTLLIHAEQGIGDETLFSSCFDEAIERAGECIITCDPRLTGLFVRSFPKAMIYGITRRVDGAINPLPDRIDYQIPAGSVLQHFRNSRSDFPDRKAYLVADKNKTALWRERFDSIGEGLKIGISWRTGGLPASRRTRITSLAQWNHLFALPGVDWINLQYGDVREDLEAERKRSGTIIHDWEDGDPLTDLDGFAARLSALDLVISVGNASAHMAGALGVESWILLPRPATWRWLLDGERIPWYPNTLTLRQQERGDWAPVFRRLQELLHERLGMAPPDSTLEFSKVASDEINFVGPDGTPLSRERTKKYYEQAEALQEAGQYDEAESIYLLILKHFPRELGAIQRIAALSVETGHTDLAIRYLKHALSAVPDNATINYSMANVYKTTRQYESAVDHYRRAIASQPTMSEAHLNLGVTCFKMGRKDDARSAFQKTLEIRPDCQAAQDNLAQLDRAFAAPHFQTGEAPTPGVPTTPDMNSQQTM